jgi:DNA-binding NarL/FixJ family response regulator
MLSMHPEDRYAMRTLKAGAKGYVSKESATEELVNAIRKVYSGGRYLSKALAEKMVDYLDDERHKPAHELLSNREFQVMCRIAKGESLDKIAKALLLSPNTIATYRERVFAKLNLKSNVELTSYAHRNGIID